MSQAAANAFDAAPHSERDALRDQRDLYRSLLLSEPGPLAAFLRRALCAADRLRSLLRSPARDEAAFRAKLADLGAAAGDVAASASGLELPTVECRLAAAQSALRELRSRHNVTGNDLLPAMVLLEELCCHLTVAADCAALHLPVEPDYGEVGADAPAPSQPKLALALRQLTEKVAAEQGRRISLVMLGLEEVPPDWNGPLFDLLAALVRNSVEHGIETADLRTARGKPEEGTLVVEFVDRGAEGCDLHCNDDGAGLNAELITDAAIRCGLMDADQARALEPPRLVSLIFQPGLSTARDGARRGHGLQIVRSHLQRLDGRVQVATKRGQFTRVHITLPPWRDREAGSEESRSQV